MRESVLRRKEARLVMKLAEALDISPEKALDVLYSTKTYRLLMEPKYGMQLMSDNYLLEDILAELK
ncbi:MAG: DUF3791 domain-containing protein [Kiritimatiellae bacterium]|nr:DUF3791 domain-containing protein [Kiritimatiellia bacterium]